MPDYACRFCRHRHDAHNPIVGCPFCRCMAHPSEATPRTEEEYAVVPIASGTCLEKYRTPLTAPLVTSGLGPLVWNGTGGHNPISFGIDVNAHNRFHEDPALQGTDQERVNRLPILARSDDWQDRIRAQIIIDSLVLSPPDDLPVIYETEDSPYQQRYASKTFPYRASQHVWVIHPNPAVLEEVLPGYQALWDAGRGERHRRKFAIGLVPGSSIRRMLLPTTTADEILTSTQQQHQLPQSALPERLRRRTK